MWSISDLYRRPLDACIVSVMLHHMRLASIYMTLRGLGVTITFTLFLCLYCNGQNINAGKLATRLPLA